MTASQTAAAPEVSASRANSRGAKPAPASVALTGDSVDTSSWPQRRLRAAIVFYQRAREGRPSPCRFFPSCSAYALESIEVHGTWRGGWLSVRRLVRCRPLGPSGFDPVPEPRSSSSEPCSVSSEPCSVSSEPCSVSSEPCSMLSDTSNHDASCSAHSPAPKGG